ncbi:MAG: hypothetical protein QW356_05550 [Candidatus Hadarchaeales archaeon]
MQLEGEFLVDAISRAERVLRKRALFVSPYCNREIECRWKYIPAYLPELGLLISLDTVSSGISKDMCDLVQVWRREGKLLLSRLYNFSLEYRRAVTRGKYSLIDVGGAAWNYSYSVFLDLLMSTPIITKSKKIISPLRWLRLEENVGYFFGADYSYNAFLIFVDLGGLGGSTETIWVGEPIGIRTLKARFVQILGDGFVKEEPVYLCLEEPVELSRGYYFCVAESFNGYETNYPPARRFLKKNLHLVRCLYPVVQSPYDIMPLFFEHSLHERNDIILQFSVPSGAVRKVLERIGKVEGVQSGELVEEYEKLWEGRARVEWGESRITFRALNPSVVPYLMKSSARSEGFLASRFLENLKLLEEAERGEPFFNLAVMGVGRIIELKNELRRSVWNH